MARSIIIKPLISEKAETQSEVLNKYHFIVDKKANKIQIKNAVEEMYEVEVVSVNTLIMPGKMKTRNTRTKILKGRTPSYKKAIVTLAEGEELDVYGDI